MPNELTPRQEKFCREYLIDLNGTQAAIRAGYSEHTANEQASQLLANLSVANRVRELQDRRAKRLDISADKVLKELAKVGFADMRDFSEWDGSNVTLKDSSDLSENETAAVSEVSATHTKEGSTVRIKLHDKLKALELVGKHLGIYTDKMELTGKGGGPIDVYELSNEERTIRIATLLHAARNSGGDGEANVGTNGGTEQASPSPDVP